MNKQNFRTKANDIMKRMYLESVDEKPQDISDMKTSKEKEEEEKKSREAYINDVKNIEEKDNEEKAP